MLRIVGLSVFLTLVVVLIFSWPASAQTAATQTTAATAEASMPTVNYFDFFVVKGGYIAFGLIGLSIVTIALTIEHCLSIRRAAVVPIDATEQIKALVDEKKYLEAIKFTGEDPSMIGYVLNAGLLEAGNGFAAMERAVEDTLDERSARMFRKIEYLSIIGNVAPMIGLFGTVVGMIMLFAEIHAADAFPGARIVADKIAISLITTFWGLAVAIPALSIYGVFRNRIDVLTAECTVAVEQILAVFNRTPSGAEEPSVSQPAEAAAGARPTGQ